MTDNLSKLTVIFAACLLSACAGFPASREELMTVDNKSNEICSDQEIDVLESRVDSYLKKCFAWKDTVIVNGIAYSNNYLVEKNSTVSGKNYIVYAPMRNQKSYLLSVVIEEGNEKCNSTVNSYAFNYWWSSHFDKIEQSVKGEEATCP